MIGDWIAEQWQKAWEERHGQKMQLAVHTVTSDLYRWEHGVWVNITSPLPRVVMAESGFAASEHTLKEILFLLKHTKPWITGDRHGLDSESPRINFLNGVFELKSGEFREHGDPWNTTNQIPHSFRDDLDEVDLEINTWGLDNFLRDRVAEDVAEAAVMWQLLGSAMLPGNPSQTFAILQGPGGSGKGTYLGIVRDVLGSENVAGLTLRQLGDRFAAVGVHGMLANIAGDVTGGVVPAYELILGIIGGDSITADRKYQTSITYAWDGLLILATNGRLILPTGAGSESGWWRRAIYLDMPNPIDAVDRIGSSQLRKQIAPDLDLVATRAARAVAKAWHLRQIPTITESMNRASATARTSGDSVSDWAEDRLVPSISPELLTGSEAYQDYVSWCQFYGHRPRGNQTFYTDLGTVLRRNKWGDRAAGRSSASRVNFSGVSIILRKVWELG